MAETIQTGNGSDAVALDTLLRVSRNVVATLDLQTILQETADGASSLFNWGTAAVYLLETNRTVRLCATCPELPPDFPDMLRISRLDDHPHFARAVDTREPVLIPDMQTAELSESERIAMTERHLRTVLFLPLVADSEVLGGLLMGTAIECSDISKHYEDMALTLANFAALAVKNALLFEEKQENIRSLERAIAERDAEKAEGEKLRQELVQAQKLEALGQLAGGVAHDFNNQLAGIMGYAELLQLGGHSEERHLFSSRILSLASRSAQLTSQLLAFSRKSPSKQERVDLHQVIDEVTGILQHTISRKISIECELDALSHSIVGDPAQVQSALLNLALNARDAMPNGGRIHFRTQNVRLVDGNNRVGSFSLPGGGYTVVSVLDSGEGIRPDVMARIFEPYFTTKEKGKGTGMGLAAVFGTMSTHGGAVEVSSSAEKGSEFRLYFPRFDTMDAPSDMQREITANDHLGKGILVIDDETMIVEMVTTQLRNAGFVSYGYSNAEDASAFFKESYADISLVLMDLVMPRMSAREMFRELKRISPDVRLVLMSGFDLDNEVQSLINEGAYALIQKPFRAALLLSTVTEALGHSD